MYSICFLKQSAPHASPFFRFLCLARLFSFEKRCHCLPVFHAAAAVLWKTLPYSTPVLQRFLHSYPWRCPLRQAHRPLFAEKAQPRGSQRPRKILYRLTPKVQTAKRRSRLVCTKKDAVFGFSENGVALFSFLRWEGQAGWKARPAVLSRQGRGSRSSVRRRSAPWGTR